MKTTNATYFVLTEGASEEKQQSWESIEEKCREGKYTPDTRIFLPDKNKWVRAGNTELKPLFPAPAPESGDKSAEAQSEEDAAESALEAEYREALKLVDQQPESLEAHLEAGRLAAQSGDRDAAREHFQNALDLNPYNSRVAKEVMRRFSKSECRDFQFLRRDPPVWDEPSDLLTYPLSGGPLYLAIPAAVLLILSLLPYGPYVAAPLAYLWLVQIARAAADGSKEPPLWKAAVSNPAREIILPLLAGALVAGLCALVVYGIGRGSMALEGSEGSAFHYVANSPVLSVALALAGLVYLPAVLTKTVHSVGIVVHLLSPYSVVRSMSRMGQEYAVSALTVLIIAAVLGGIRLGLGGIPLMGKLVFAAAAACLIPVVGLILGRLAGRMRHVL